jgi:hypothetical protein
MFRDQFTAMATQDAEKTLQDAVMFSFDNHVGRIERAMRD